MLYDPKWDKPSVAGFRAWLERQDPDETFTYADCERCAVGQYLISIGSHWRRADCSMVNTLNAFVCLAHSRMLSPTFGAVLREMDEAA